ncbi:hypothetical protein B0O99DRAFT_521045 [Bisporella sp. PMI_857]|nr:hypothetical protein B0O99DRAFT_521045 [Bisporella sp. PMI_857]
MSGRGSRAPRGRSRASKAQTAQNGVPDVYAEMLRETLPAQSQVSERPLKRRRTGRRTEVTAAAKSDHEIAGPVERTAPAVNDDEDDELEFEDVEINSRESSVFSTFGSEKGKGKEKELQTMYRESGDESDEESEQDWEGFDFDFDAETPVEGPSGDLELTLTRKEEPKKKPSTAARKILNKEEKDVRLMVHKMHVLCFMAFLERRNRWCNDYDVQKELRQHLTKKMVTFVNPDKKLPQFGRANSLKRGLADIGEMWKKRFQVTEQGLRRALWADNPKDLEGIRYTYPDTCHAKEDFLKAAKDLKGSRDVGAQLYVALLRSAGVECRLVCSIQPLSIGSGHPRLHPLPASSEEALREARQENLSQPPPTAMTASNYQFASPGGASLSITNPRRRLGHTGTDYELPSIAAPARREPPRKHIHDSENPVFWVEVLDEAHQKWVPVDPLVTESIAKPRSFEPSFSRDELNGMNYVIAFEEDGSARDVTRRYVKAYNGKTRKMRVESTPGGQKWWQKVVGKYDRGWIDKTAYDELEDEELAAAEAREPMPKNIVDFKDHPVYALERHLKRNEVLVGKKAVGTVAAGRDPAKPGLKKLESVFRRRDVKSVKSSEAWYRLGRDIKMGEQPVKTVEPKKRPDDEEDEVDERPGTNLYTEEQTEIYVPPPIVNGRVPKNSFGNIDVYVPSMVPAGGVHIRNSEAAYAARLLGIDYSDALTGFSFRGRHGTAVLTGVVVASEYREAVEAVLDGMSDERARVEEERRAARAVAMWKRWLVMLRVKERVDSYKVEGEEDDDEEEAAAANNESENDGDIADADDASSVSTEEYVEEDFEGGGFFPE